MSRGHPFDRPFAWSLDSWRLFTSSTIAAFVKVANITPLLRTMVVALHPLSWIILRYRIVLAVAYVRTFAWHTVGAGDISIFIPPLGSLELTLARYTIWRSTMTTPLFVSRVHFVLTLALRKQTRWNRPTNGARTRMDRER